jgi:glucosamine--fructose-6-phosphate aminotransferase (isomerizing)
MPLMQDEIHQQPDVLAALLENELQNTLTYAERLQQRNTIKYVLIAARGTSDNAARYGQYLLGARNRLAVGLATPSLFSIYKEPPRLDEALVIGISQSGQSADIVAVLAEARRQGRPTLAITNDVSSPLAEQADHVIPLHAGEERAVAASKTYTAELMALAMLSCGLHGGQQGAEHLHQIPALVSEVLEQEAATASAVERYRYLDSCVVLGRGYNYATAFEIALKLKELSYLIAEPYSSADFMHGPMALISGDLPALVVAPSGKMFDTMQAFCGELRARGAELIVVSDQKMLLDSATTPLLLPHGLPEWLSPIVAVIPGQMFALHLTLVKGHDPDQPRGLQKVTITL